MLIEFRVENHRSLFEEQALTFECSGLGNPSDTRPREIEGHSVPLLPVCVIYGANASGKSNVLSALNFMRESVIYSHRRWEPDTGVPRLPFAWADGLDMPSTFEVTFVQRGTKYQYGFSANDEVIEEEWLFAWPNKRKQVWLERDHDTYKFGDNLKGPNESVREVTRANALFLSAAAQNNHQQLSLIFAWFRNIIVTSASGKSNPTYNSRYFLGNIEQPVLLKDFDKKDFIYRLVELLQAADTGVVNVKMVEEEPIMRRSSGSSIMLQHQRENDTSWLNLEDESEGTKTLLRIAPSLFRVLDNGSVLIIDELESSLHPLLALTILNLFNSPEINPKNAQLLFTTHDTNLLGTTLGEPPLRRDQIWFTEKDDTGKSCLYPLTDFKPRQTENLERGYLQGRYGAIPFLGDIRMGMFY
ncbi:MAG: ATP-binding protein [Symploca sp. SIO1C2]|nr:ATP-binding protein [Symploca sp. SIO1C2]